MLDAHVASGREALTNCFNFGPLVPTIPYYVTMGTKHRAPPSFLKGIPFLRIHSELPDSSLYLRIDVFLRLSSFFSVSSPSGTLVSSLQRSYAHPQHNH